MRTLSVSLLGAENHSCVRFSKEISRELSRERKDPRFEEEADRAIHVPPGEPYRKKYAEADRRAGEYEEDRCVPRVIGKTTMGGSDAELSHGNPMGLPPRKREKSDEPQSSEHTA